MPLPAETGEFPWHSDVPLASAASNRLLSKTDTPKRIRRRPAAGRIGVPDTYVLDASRLRSKMDQVISEIISHGGSCPAHLCGRLRISPLSPLALPGKNNAGPLGRGVGDPPAGSRVTSSSPPVAN